MSTFQYAQSAGDLERAGSDFVCSPRVGHHPSDLETLTRARLRRGLVLLVDDGRWMAARALLHRYVGDLVGWQIWLPKELLDAGLALGLRCEALPDEEVAGFVEGLARAGDIGVIFDLRLQSIESKMGWARAFPGIHAALCVHVCGLAAGAEFLLKLIDLQAEHRVPVGRPTGWKRPGSAWMQAARTYLARA